MIRNVSPVSTDRVSNIPHRSAARIAADSFEHSGMHPAANVFRPVPVEVLTRKIATIRGASIPYISTQRMQAAIHVGTQCFSLSYITAFFALSGDKVKSGTIWVEPSLILKAVAFCCGASASIAYACIEDYHLDEDDHLLMTGKISGIHYSERKPIARILSEHGFVLSRGENQEVIFTRGSGEALQRIVYEGPWSGGYSHGPVVLTHFPVRIAALLSTGLDTDI